MAALHLFCRNRVEDFDRWHRVFTSDDPALAAAGLRLVHLWRELDREDEVFFLFEVESVERALAFMNDPASVDAGRRAGVLDGEYHFLRRL